MYCMKKSFSLSLRDMLYDDSCEGFFFHPDTLETERLILRPFHLRDLKDVHDYSADPEVARYVLWEPHATLAETRSYLRWMKRNYRHGLPGSWAVELKENNRVIGSIGYMWVNRENSSAEVGYSYARDQWNKGIATEALKKVIAFSFDHLRLNRIEAQHDIRNPASGRVMEKCRMVKEGTLRERIYNKGEFINVDLWSILASDQR